MKSKRRTKKELIELLDDQDLEELRLKLNPSNNSLNYDDDLKNLLETYSYTDLLNEVLTLKSDSLEMIADIYNFLVSESVSIRTTGHYLSLESSELLDIQTIGLAASWDRTKLLSNESSWTTMSEEMDSKIKLPIEKLLSEVKPELFYERNDPLDDPIEFRLQMIKNKRRGIITNPFESKKVLVYDENGLKYAICILERFENISSKIALISGDEESEFQRFKNKFQSFINSSKSKLAEMKRFIEQEKHEAVIRLGRYELIPQWQINEMNKFRENILFNMNLSECEQLSDLFKISLFRNRPQLYEVWILTQLLSFYRENGFIVNILLKSVDEDRAIWNLNYSQSKKSIAIISESQSNQTHFDLYYQFFHKGKVRNEMPDIVLKKYSEGQFSIIYVIDPKHSKNSYTIKTYEEVITRYSDVFNADCTLVTEYYKRNFSNPYEVDQNANKLILTDVSPRGMGRAIFLSKLNELHSLRTLIIIDVSASNLRFLSLIQNDISRKEKKGVRFHEEILLFSENAELVSKNQFLSDTELARYTEILGSKNTLFQSVISALNNSQLQNTNSLNRILLYTDGEFYEIKLDQAIQELNEYFSVQVVNFAQA